jgi:hypothetical protein
VVAKEVHDRLAQFNSECPIALCIPFQRRRKIRVNLSYLRKKSTD